MLRDAEDEEALARVDNILSNLERVLADSTQLKTAGFSHIAATIARELDTGVRALAGSLMSSLHGEKSLVAQKKIHRFLKQIN